MSEPSPSTPAASLRPEDLSIVLFGMPAAGKSSLLGALAQAAQAQEHLLNGRLTDVSHGLDELRQRVYDESPRRTADEVVPYPVDFEPFNPDGRKAESNRPIGAVVIDCDGRVANDLLVRRQALPEDSPEGTLAHEVLQADTLVLVIDASAPPAQVEADFAEFDRFLRQLESSRSQRAEVGGLPVFLVLTKCDLLAREGDRASDWMERIEQHKRDVDTRFRAFLARREQEYGPLPFGQIELHLWATAVKRPALAGSPARSREPYGVAELFRQCLEQAAAFRGRQRQSGRRLLWTVGGAAGLLALMTSLAVAFTVKNLDTQTNELRARVDPIVFADLPSAAERLHGSIRELRARADTLATIRDDPQFGSLPTEQQQLVRDRLEELRAYLSYLDRLRQAPRPQDVHTEKALREIKESLRTELKLPQAEWSVTDAGQLYSQRLQDVEALEAAVKRARNWYLDSVEKADALWTFQGQQTGPEAAGVNWDAWTREVETLLSPDRRPAFRGSSPVPGAASTLTYDATILRFEEVVKARTEWEADQRRLQRVLELSGALGLATLSDKRPPVLVFPRQFSLAQAQDRRRALVQYYPNYQSDFILDRIPEAIRPRVRQVARTSYEHLLEPARAAVLSQLQQAGGGAEETKARWESVRTWLRDPRELEDWRVLAAALARLHDPESGDPVAVLAAFLSQGSFTLDLRRLTLEIPESLGVKPDGEAALSLYLGDGEKPALVFEPSGDPERDAIRRVWIYAYRPREGQRLTYQPGDVLWATLPLRENLALTWVRCHSLMYQFERLARPPWLHKKGEEPTRGTWEERIHLTITPPDGLPRIPDLLPVVRLERKD